MTQVKNVENVTSGMEISKEASAIVERSVSESEELLLQEDATRNPTVQNKGKDMELNFKKLEFCDRESFNIHDKENNVNDKNVKGSANKSCVYMDLNAGIFEAAKMNLVRVLEKELHIYLVKKPKVETYGTSEAVERILLDMKMTVNDKEHEVKIRVYNTLCSLDVTGKGAATIAAKKHEHLENNTVAGYFIEKVMPKVVQYLRNNFDIPKLNEYCRKLALIGVDETKDTCFYCEKENRDKNILKCTGCKSILHLKCAGKTGISNQSLEEINKKPETFTCNPCMSGFTSRN